MFTIVLANLWKLDLYVKVFTILAIQHLPYTKRQSSRTFLSQLVPPYEDGRQERTYVLRFSIYNNALDNFSVDCHWI